MINPFFYILERHGWMDHPTRCLLETLVHCRCNLVVCGPSASANTNLLQALLFSAHCQENIGVVQDTAGLVERDVAMSIYTLDEMPSSNKIACLRFCSMQGLSRIIHDGLNYDDIKTSSWTMMIDLMNKGFDGSIISIRSDCSHGACALLTESVQNGRKDYPLWAARALEDINMVIDAFVEVKDVGLNRVVVNVFDHTGESDLHMLPSRLREKGIFYGLDIVMQRLWIEAQTRIYVV